MSITPTTGATASLASPATSLAFAANTLTNGQIVVVAISIPGTTTVSSISDTVNTYTKQSAVTNGSSVRSEIWTAPVTASTASRTITINFSGSTLASAAYEEYAGYTAIGNIGTPATGTGGGAGSAVTTQDNGSYSVTAVAVATLSGDTFIGWIGTVRQSVIPALTTAGTALVDSTSSYIATSPDGITPSNSARTWASVSLELRTGVSPLTITGESFVGPAIKSAQNFQVIKAPPSTQGVQPTPVAQILQNGFTGIAYSETISGVSGTAPYTFALTSGSIPAGTSLNGTTGVISGTPNTSTTYNFTITVTDANGLTGSYAFRIIVQSPITPIPTAQVLAGGTTGVAYSETISSQGGTAPIAYTVTSGSLPTSLSLNSSTGVISGTPTVAGTYNFTVTATDTNSLTGATNFTIVISAPSASGGGSFTFIG